jgi:hypothetical protein
MMAGPQQIIAYVSSSALPTPGAAMLWQQAGTRSGHPAGAAGSGFDGIALACSGCAHSLPGQNFEGRRLA